ncbi:MAG: hypothetical protein ACRD0I_10590 [Acidimicrobiales bacterium]
MASPSRFSCPGVPAVLIALVVLVCLATLVFPVSPADAMFVSAPNPSGTTPVSTALLAPPTGLTHNPSGNAITLTWTASTSPFVRSYEILRSDNGGGYAVVASGITGTSYVDSVPINTTGTYTWTAVAVDYNWTSVASAPTTSNCSFFLLLFWSCN